MNDKEQRLVELLADLSDRRTKEQKSVAAGYSEKHVYRKQRSPEFRRAVQERVRENLGVDLARVFGVLVQEAVDGNLKAAELLLKAAGWIATGGQTNITTVHGQRSEPDETLADRFDAVRRKREADLAKYRNDDSNH